MLRVNPRVVQLVMGMDGAVRIWMQKLMVLSLAPGKSLRKPVAAATVTSASYRSP